MARSRHTTDRKASTVYLLSGVLALLQLLLWPPALPPGPWVTSLTFVLATLLPFAIGTALALGLRTGQRWVKALFLGYSLLNFLVSDPRLYLSSVPRLPTLLPLLGVGLHLWAIFLVARDLVHRKSAAVLEQPKK